MMVGATSCQLLTDVQNPPTTTKDHNHNYGTSIAEVRRSSQKKQFKTQIVWFNAVGFFGLYMAMFYGIYLIFFSTMFITVLWTYLLMLYAGFSTTIGAHRLFTHRSFKAATILKITLLIGQTIAAQNCMWVWVRDHRQHHKFSDTDADPHNSSRGVFFSHVGWLMVKKHPLVIEKGRTIDMSDMNADPYVMFQKRFYKTVFFILAVLIPFTVPYFVWEESLLCCIMVPVITRIHLTNNIVWLVNSWAHCWGNKPYDKYIASIESFWVSLFCLGEGWHNYHHSFPYDYRTSEPGQRPNISTAIIDVLALIGWAYDLKSASSHIIARKILKDGDGSHPLSNRSLEEIAQSVEEKQILRKNIHNFSE